MERKDKPPKGYRLVKRGKVRVGDRCYSLRWDDPEPKGSPWIGARVDEMIAVARKIRGK